MTIIFTTFSLKQNEEIITTIYNKGIFQKHIGDVVLQSLKNASKTFLSNNITYKGKSKDVYEIVKKQAWRYDGNYPEVFHI